MHQSAIIVDHLYEYKRYVGGDIWRLWLILMMNWRRGGCHCACWWGWWFLCGEVGAAHIHKQCQRHIGGMDRPSRCVHEAVYIFVYAFRVHIVYYNVVRFVYITSCTKTSVPSCTRLSFVKWRREPIPEIHPTSCIEFVDVKYCVVNWSSTDELLLLFTVCSWVAFANPCFSEP